MSKFCEHTCDTMKERGAILSRSFDQMSATLNQCSGCGYKTFSPLPSPEMLDEFYAQGFWDPEETKKNAALNYAEYDENNGPDIFARFTALFEASGIKKLKMRVHDVGCGYGSAVYGLNKAGARATGTDLSSLSIEVGKNHGNDAIYLSSTEDYLIRCGEKMDVILMSHSLEHMLDPVATLNALTPHLADDGFLFILVPNGLYVRAVVDTFNHWPWFTFPQHLHYFTPKSFTCLFGKTGLRLIDVASEPSEQWREEFAQTMFNRTKNQIPDWDSVLTALSNNVMGCELNVVATKQGSPLNATQRSINILSSLGDEKSYEQRTAESNARNTGTSAVPPSQKEMLESILNSTSWRITAPLRAANAYIANICGWARR